MSKIGEDIYRCELCKHDYTLDAFKCAPINGVDITKHNSEGIRLGLPQEHVIHICGKCVGRIRAHD